MSTVSAPAPASGDFSTRDECTALAQAIAIRARVKLAQAYASLYESWNTEEQGRDTGQGAQAETQPMDAVGSLPTGPRTAGQRPMSSPTGQRRVRGHRKSWPFLLRLTR
jgi:hypothetical protein